MDYKRVKELGSHSMYQFDLLAPPDTAVPQGSRLVGEPEQPSMQVVVPGNRHERRAAKAKQRHARRRR